MATDTPAKKAPAKKTAARKTAAKKTTARRMPKLKVGDHVTALVDSRDNNGFDEAVAVVTRVWSPEMVNLRVFLDGPEVLWLTSVNVVKGRPEYETLGNNTAPPRVCFKA